MEISTQMDGQIVVVSIVGRIDVRHRCTGHQPRGEGAGPRLIPDHDPGC